MQIDVESNLHKLRGRDVWGVLSVAYNERVGRLFHVTTHDSRIHISARSFFMSIDSPPILSQIKEPRHRAMVSVFGEVLFPQVQRFYDQTDPQPKHEHALPNMSIQKRELRSSIHRTLSIHNPNEMCEFEALLGKEDDQAWQVSIHHSALLQRVINKMNKNKLNHE